MEKVTRNQIIAQLIYSVVDQLIKIADELVVLDRKPRKREFKLYEPRVRR